MKPRFATVVDPIFLKVLSLMESVEGDDVISPESERQSLERLFGESEAQTSEGPSWQLAKYALASWIDDLLISAEWSGRDWWESNSMEFALFNSRDRATQFFIRSKEAAELPQRDALEVFYLCAVLGFRGLYQLSEAQIIAGQLDLPMSLEAWTKNTAGALHLRQGRPPIRETPRVPTGAPPLESRFRVVGAAVVTVILSMLTATLLWLNNILSASPT